MSASRAWITRDAGATGGTGGVLGTLPGRPAAAPGLGLRLLLLLLLGPLHASEQRHELIPLALARGRPPPGMGRLVRPNPAAGRA